MRRRVGLAVAVALMLVMGAALATAQFRMDRGQDVSPTFDGWERNPDGTFSLYFGYYNRNAAEEVDIPIGPNNTMDGGGDRGQPTHFYSGRRWWVFKVVVPKDWPKDQRLTWTLNNRGHINVAKGWLLDVWEVDTDLLSRAGGDRFLFVGGGEDASADLENRAPVLTGPPTAMVTIPQSATLTVNAKDDGRPKPPAKTTARTKAQGLRFRWIVFRGAGAVRFDPPTNGPFPGSEAKAETRVEFSAPGTYRLRAIGSDGQLSSYHDVDVVVNPGAF